MISTIGKTKEEVVSEMFQQLVMQGKQCVDIVHACRYGNDDGDHCAVGFLLDEEDEGLMESGMSADDLIDSEYGALGENDNFMQENKLLLCQCQEIHDAITVRKLIDSMAGLTNYLDSIPPWVCNWVTLHVEQMSISHEI